MCECGDLRCREELTLTYEEYVGVRRNARRFFIRPEHDILDVERVVERHETYWVVEKNAAVAEIVEEG